MDEPWNAGRATEPPDEAGDADLGGAEMAALIDRLPGAWERIEAGVQQARRGETIPLDDL
jgi:hypothetical protein